MAFLAGTDGRQGQPQQRACSGPESHSAGHTCPGGGEHPEHLGYERSRGAAGPEQQAHRRVDLPGEAVQGERQQGDQDLPRMWQGKAILAREPGTVVLLLSHMERGMLPVGNPQRQMKAKTDVRQGTLALMVLKTLDVLGPLHGYGIARRIEQISGDLLAVNQGTLYPVLLKLEQEGAIASEWGASENNRRARFYRLTREGRKQLQVETQDWEQTAAIIARFFEVKAEDFS